MRAVIDLPDEQIEPLKTLASSLNVSRAELIRRAVANYLRRFEAPTDDTVFGILKQRGEDGLAYQERMRSEGDRSGRCSTPTCATLRTSGTTSPASACPTRSSRMADASRKQAFKDQVR